MTGPRDAWDGVGARVSEARHGLVLLDYDGTLALYFVTA
jgi:hypothetical protein